MCQFSQTFTVWNTSNVRFQITKTLVLSDVIKIEIVQVTVLRVLTFLFLRKC